MAALEKAGKRWRVREFSDGKLKTVANFKTKPEAEALVRKLGVQKSARAVVRAAQIPMDELAVRWRINRIANDNDRESTELAEKRIVALCEARDWSSTASITSAAVDKAREDGVGARVLALVRALLNWSRRLNQYVDDAAIAALKPPGEGRKAKDPLLSDAAVEALCARADRMNPSAGALIHCLTTYGWRPITAARLKVGDYDSSTATITTLVKGGDVVQHPVLDETATRLRLLTAGRAKTAPLFWNPQTGKSWPTYGARAIPQWARDHLGIKSYDLKRYAITSMLDRGLPPHTVALFTGHRTITQLMRYARSNEAKAKAALALIGHGRHGKNLETGANEAQPTDLG